MDASAETILPATVPVEHHPHRVIIPRRTQVTLVEGGEQTRDARTMLAMAAWRDPPHERVRLSPWEVRAVDELERRFYDEPVRRRWTRRIGRIAPWLLPIGATLMLVSLSHSFVMSACGAVLTGLGMAACLHTSWFRSRHLRDRVRRRPH